MKKANKNPATASTVDAPIVHSLHVENFDEALVSKPHITKHRIHKEGFTEAFRVEALTQVQERLFGKWKLLGEKGGNDVFADRCSVYIFGQFYGRDGLDLKTRGLLVLSALTVWLRDGVIQTWTNACLNLGWSEDQIKELGALASHVNGYPPIRGSLLIFDDVFEKHRARVGGLSPQPGAGSVGTPAAAPGDLYRKGAELATRLFGTSDGDFADIPIAANDDFRKEMVTWVFGYLFTERSLIPLKAKVLAVIAMSIAAGHQTMFRRWITAARNVGCSRLELQETVLTMAVYAGWPVAYDALNVLAEEWAPDF